MYQRLGPLCKVQTKKPKKHLGKGFCKCLDKLTEKFFAVGIAYALPEVTER